MKTNHFLKIAFTFNLLTFFFINNTLANRVCGEAQVRDAAWGMDNGQRNLLRSNLTEPRNAGLSFEAIKTRIENRMRNNTSCPVPPNLSQLAGTIANIAICTGHDFTYLTAVIEKESCYCTNLGGGSGSGCGQMTTPAIDEMKNQMGITTDPGHSEVAQYISATVNSCSTQLGNANIATEFNQLMGQPSNRIRENLRNGSNFSTDILLAALTLKFFTAKQGGYLVAGDRRGGLAEYNGGGIAGYAGDVNTRAQNISLRCYEDNYTPDIQHRACFLGPNRASCASETSAPAGSVEI